MSQLDVLPVEILHRIFDFLDVQTLVFSLRNVCKRFYLVTQSYNRYRWNFQSMCKANLRRICQIISTSNVISLTLSDDDRTRGQIEYFLRQCSVENLTRLRSLNLIEIESIHLEIFLDFLCKTNLTDLSIDFLPLHLNRTRNFCVSRLSSAIGHSTLKNFQLNILSDHWDRLVWPQNDQLTSLHLIHSITLVQFVRILQQSIHLEKFVLKEIPHCDLNENFDEKTFPQLRSLIIEDCRIDIEKVDRCLTLIPSLKYLKLIGKGTLFDSSFNGYRWESLIQKKLVELKTFEFFFTILIYSNYHSHHMNLLMTPFRTSFWSRQMRCSIVCDYISNSRKILLYTSPICVDHFVFHNDFKKISLANFTRSNDENLMSNVTTLELQLTKEINRSPVSLQKHPLLFHHVTSLTLGNDGEWPTNSLPFLSSIIDLSQIVHLSLSVNFFLDSMKNLIEHLQILFTRATNLRVLYLFDYWPAENFYPRMETICSLISPNVKHLQIRVKNIDEMKFLLEHLENLTSVTFQYAQMLKIQRDELLRSLENFRRFSSIWNSENALNIWLGNRKEFFFDEK